MQGYSASGAGYKIRRADLLWGPFFNLLTWDDVFLKL